MDLRRFQYFERLAEAGSLHRAAHLLGLSQPALSQSIRALEAEIGVRLVERSPSGTHLTQAGEAFLHEIRLVLAALNRAVRIAKLVEDTPTPLRLGITPDIVTDRLIGLLQIFSQYIRGNCIMVNDGSDSEISSMLDANLLDLILIGNKQAADHHNSTVYLWHEKINIALPASHPLVTETAIDLQALEGQAVIVRAGSDTNAVDRSLLQGCQAAGITLRIVASMHHQEARLAMVAAGLGATAVLAGEPGRKWNGVAFRPTIPTLSFGVRAVWRGFTPTLQAQRFLGIARAMITDENPPPSAHRAAPE